MADGVGFDLGKRAFSVAERAQGFRHRLVDDFEVAAAGEFLEFNEREIGLDAGRVAIHHEADGAGRRDDGRLGIAIAMLLTEFEGAVPGPSRRVAKASVFEGGVVQRHRCNGELFIKLCLAVRGAPMVAHDAQHVVGVRLVTRERPEFGGHLGARRVGNAGHDR